MNSADRSTRAWRIGGGFILIAAIAYAYSNINACPFIFDDGSAIVNNPGIRRVWPIWHAMFPGGNNVISGRPLVELSFAINYAIGGVNPRGYHIGNIALHAMVSLALYAVFRRLLRRIAHPASDGVALAAALLWCVHPLLTECVTYTLNRTEELVSLFMLLAIYSFFRSIDSQRPLMWKTLALICALGATGSKEVAAMFPPILFLLDVLLVTQSWRETLRQRWRFHLVLLCAVYIALPLIVMTAVSLHTRAGMTGQATPWQYLLMQSQVITHYLQLAIWPKPLVICYVDWPVPHAIADVWPTFLFVGALVAITVYLTLRRSRWAIVGAWFFLILGPTSSILPIDLEPAAERRMYLPLAGLILTVVLIGERLTRRLPRREIVQAICVAAIAFFYTQFTLARNDDYQSDLTIWADAVAHRPNNAYAHAGLGAAFRRRGDWPDALDSFNRALAIDPGLTAARADRGLARIALGQKNEGLDDLLESVRRAPNNPICWTALGWGYQKLGQADNANDAIHHALNLLPHYPVAEELLASPDYPATMLSTSPQ